MMYMNHFNHLNTIEEEKHETQTSNYFREGESERDPLPARKLPRRHHRQREDRELHRRRVYRKPGR